MVAHKHSVGDEAEMVRRCLIGGWRKMIPNLRDNQRQQWMSVITLKIKYIYYIKVKLLEMSQFLNIWQHKELVVVISNTVHII